MSGVFDRRNLESQLNARVSSNFSRVLVGEKDDESGMRYVFLLPRRLLTHDEVIKTCTEIAPLIRREVGVKPDGWAAGIAVQRISEDVMGVYYLGWLGHPDEWRAFGRQTDHADWLTLQQRLHALLSSHGVEQPDGEGSGDFSLQDEDEDDGRPRISLAIFNIEFLTPELVDRIQALLRDGFADWYVVVRLILPFADRAPPDGIVIMANEVREEWNRARLRKRLGDRFRF